MSELILDSRHPDFDPNDPRHDTRTSEERRNERLEEKLDLILAKMEKVEEMTVTVIEQVKPAIDDLMNSSLGKMLGIKKGK